MRKFEEEVFADNSLEPGLPRIEKKLYEGGFAKKISGAGVTEEEASIEESTGEAKVRVDMEFSQVLRRFAQG